jgi:hypothetical protein
MANIGGIWKRKGTKGSFLSGQIEIDGKKIPFVAFENKYKDTPNKPDFVILPKQLREEPAGNFEDVSGVPF